MLLNINVAKVAKVLGNFDFVKTQAMMEDLGWTWGESDVSPTVSEMVDMAHKLLVKACNDTGFCAYGGFEATFDYGIFTLKFVTEESSNADEFVFTPNLEKVA